MLWFDLNQVRQNAKAATTEDLLDRLTVYRAGMEPAAIEVIEAELDKRGIGEQVVRLRQQVVEPERRSRRFKRQWRSFAPREDAVEIQIPITLRQAGVGARVRGIDPDRSLQIIAGSNQIVAIEIVQQISALKMVFLSLDVLVARSRQGSLLTGRQTKVNAVSDPFCHTSL